ncbi:hypothetical protein FKP32DRAFT_1589087 [Trametes sanguinea]|nr:hypothetical protein FKP32DRAFT_1589087 [Trametes sanguinea]
MYRLQAFAATCFTVAMHSRATAVTSLMGTMHDLHNIPSCRSGHSATSNEHCHRIGCKILVTAHWGTGARGFVHVDVHALNKRNTTEAR